jgi:phospholipid/cholesterol/gamma-HCH transport system permease protein
MMFEWLGKQIVNGLACIGEATTFIARVCMALPKRWTHAADVVLQIFNSGVLSLVIILISGLFIGMVVSLQGYNTLVTFSAETQLGPLVALSVFRELGPVVTGLLFAGRAGSSLAAELGLMQITEQIDSMRMMAIDPFRRVLFSRFLSAILVMPMLYVFFCLMAIWGGYLVGVDWLGMDAGIFVSNLKDAVSFYDDIMQGFYKSLIFGVLISWVSVYQGFHAVRSSEGVARAATKTVVFSSLLILGFDFIITAMM